MEGFPLLGDKHDIIAPCGADIRYHVIEAAAEEIARYGRLGMLPREDNPETVEPLTVGDDVRYKTITKKKVFGIAKPFLLRFL